MCALHCLYLEGHIILDYSYLAMKISFSVDSHSSGSALLSGALLTRLE